MQVHLDVLSKRQDYSNLLADFTALVKTRLADHNVTSFEKNEIAATKLIQHAIDDFEISGHISSKVIEVSTFSSQFYINCFLPLLLSGSTREDKNRQALIMELFRFVCVML